MKFQKPIHSLMP